MFVYFVFMLIRRRRKSGMGKWATSGMQANAIEMNKIIMTEARSESGEGKKNHFVAIRKERIVLFSVNQYHFSI